MSCTEYKRQWREIFVVTVIFPDAFGLYGQVTKRARWMPWQSEAMKDVVACEKLRGGGKQPLIRRSLNGETHLFIGIVN